MSEERPFVDRMLVPKMFGFLLVICGFFTAVGFYFPQKVSAPPAKLDYKTLENMDELVNHGKNLAFSPGMGCTACHGIGDPSKTRCPDWDGVGSRAASREEGKSATEYLHEAIKRPSAYVVEGFGDIMQVPPIPDERDIYAMVAYLQSLGGTPDKAILETVKAMPEPELKKEKPVWALTPEEHGKKIVAEYGGCMTCHAIGNDDPDSDTYNENYAKVGPSLTGFAARTHVDPASGKEVPNDFTYLFNSIHDPDKVIAKGCNGDPEGACFPGVMPKTFANPDEATYMSETYVRDIAAYLWSLSGKTFDPADAKLDKLGRLDAPDKKALSPDTKIKWTSEAVALLNERFAFARPMIQSSVERYARENGFRTVTPALFEEARGKSSPPPFITKMQERGEP